eukprot:GHRQ01016745.1.p1 GENE.GHRQ01016745.1~~GHRQ01016745.1.p1  ORF type:complete len:167 (+),score=44.85 GHRQ01016745.1:872-1372(+)
MSLRNCRSNLVDATLTSTPMGLVAIHFIRNSMKAQQGVAADITPSVKAVRQSLPRSSAAVFTDAQRTRSDSHESMATVEWLQFCRLRWSSSSSATAVQQQQQQERQRSSSAAAVQQQQQQQRPPAAKPQLHEGGCAQLRFLNALLLLAGALYSMQHKSLTIISQTC